MKYQTNYNRVGSMGEPKSELPSMTVPNQAMSISEVIARHDLSGILMADGRLVYPDQEMEEVIFPMNVDLTDIEDMRERVAYLKGKIKEAQSREADTVKKSNISDTDNEKQ